MFECLLRWCDIPKRNPAEGVFGVGGGCCDSRQRTAEQIGVVRSAVWERERKKVIEEEEGPRRGLVSSLWGDVLN